HEPQSFEFKSPFQVVVKLGAQQSIMLQSPHYNSGSNADFPGKLHDRVLVKRDTGPFQAIVQIRGDEMVLGEAVGFFLELGAVRLLVVDVDGLLCVPKDVAGLVEEGEPKVIVCPIAQAKVDKRTCA